MQGSFILKFKKFAIILLLFFTSLQLCVFFSIENLLCIVIVIIGWLITNNYLFSKDVFLKFPLSSLIILGFSSTQFFLPLCFTILEGKPLIFNLLYPYQVFLHSLLALLVLILVHHIYKVSSYNTKFIGKARWQKLLYSTGLFDVPNQNQLWVMGIIGISATVIPAFFGAIKSSDINNNGGDVLAKFFDGFLPFSVAPYLYVITNLYGGGKKKLARPFVLKIVIYTILLIIIGIIANSRGLFMSNLTAIGIGYLLALFLEKYSIPMIKTKTLILVIFLFWVVIGPLADIGSAMVAVRGERNNLDAGELLSETLKAYNDKHFLNEYKVTAKESINITGWDETYFDNIFISRFCNLKFNDNSLSAYNKIGRIDEVMVDYTISRFWSIFPTPIIRLFDSQYDKNKFIQTSFGDYLFLRSGGSNALGGLRVGQFAGVGMATFSWWYLFILAIGAYPLFFMFDLFSILIFSSTKKLEAVIGVAGLVQITSIFLFFASSTSSESVTNIYTFLIRGWVQMVLLYIIIYKASKIFK